MPRGDGTGPPWGSGSGTGRGMGRGGKGGGRMGVGWGVTAPEPALAGNVFALIAVPGCLIK